MVLDPHDITWYPYTMHETCLGDEDRLRTPMKRWDFWVETIPLNSDARFYHGFYMIFYSLWFLHTVDGCEILHQLVDGLSMFIPLQSYYLLIMFYNHPRVTNWCRILPSTVGWICFGVPGATVQCQFLAIPFLMKLDWPRFLKSEIADGWIYQTICQKLLFFDLKEAADLGSEPRFHLSRRETQLEAGTPSESADPSAQPTRRQPSLAKMKFFGHWIGHGW